MDSKWTYNLLPSTYPDNYHDSPNTVDLATYFANCRPNEPTTVVRPVSYQNADLLQQVINETIGVLPDLPLDTISDVCQDLIDRMVKDHGLQPSSPSPPPVPMETSVEDLWASHDDDLEIFN